MTTIVYITNRKDCRIEWFFDSLAIQLSEFPDERFQVVVVDHWAESYGDWNDLDVKFRIIEFRKLGFKIASMTGFQFKHVPPKPTVWSGKYRLTTKNYFSPSNSRNTGLCLAPDGYIAYVDDLSVLLPGWLRSVMQAQHGNYIGLGTYRKVLKLVVKDGLVESFEDHPSGWDSRRQFFKSEEPFSVAGSWLYGCSLCLPVEALLEINGWNENCDGRGAEDSITGIMLQRKNNIFMMCPQMQTFESEERHFLEAPFKRIIKPKEGWVDSSHMILHQAIHGESLWFPNYQNMREVREKVLNGEPFPILQIPEHDFIDSQPLMEM